MVILHSRDGKHIINIIITNNCTALSPVSPHSILCVSQKHDQSALCSHTYTHTHTCAPTTGNQFSPSLRAHAHTHTHTYIHHQVPPSLRSRSLALVYEKLTRSSGVTRQAHYLNIHTGTRAVPLCIHQVSAPLTHACAEKSKQPPYSIAYSSIANGTPLTGRQ